MVRKMARTVICSIWTLFCAYYIQRRWLQMRGKAQIVSCKSPHYSRAVACIVHGPWYGVDLGLGQSL